MSKSLKIDETKYPILSEALTSARPKKQSKPELNLNEPHSSTFRFRRGEVIARTLGAELEFSFQINMELVETQWAQYLENETKQIQKYSNPKEAAQELEDLKKQQNFYLKEAEQELLQAIGPAYNSGIEIITDTGTIKFNFEYLKVFFNNKEIQSGMNVEDFWPDWEQVGEFEYIEGPRFNID